MCIHPIHAWQGKQCGSDGKCHIYFTPPSNTEDFFKLYIPLPCGKCIGCLDDKRKNWVNRLLLEFDYLPIGSFITLTYNDDFVPDKPLKSHVQKFLKRFRNIPRDIKGIPPLPPNFKYFFCGERGGQGGRPHYHGLLFGVDLMADCWLPYVATYKDGKPLFSSKILETKWPFGFCTIDIITSGCCRYVAKYTTKQAGQEDSFTLKSPRLGVSSFFKINKHGRKVAYEYRHKDTYDRLLDGTIHISGDKGKLTKIRIPNSIVAYAEKVDDFSYLDIKAVRKLQAQEFSKNFDLAAYVERLKDTDKKEKLKRKLHNEKNGVRNS